ncbi:MAG: hypoxanthine phosphoribosyltransferase [Syntrophomonadaceae bacterium]
MDSSGIGNIIFTQEQIQKRIAEVGSEITRDYRDKDLVVVSVLKGSLYFVADLTRCIDLPLEVDFLSIGLSSDPPSKKPERFTSPKTWISIIKGRDVLLAEDVIGTGLTLGYICQHLEAYEPASLKICTLLDNPAERLLTIKIDYRCFEMPDTFLIGYGLDYREKYRNLPYIAEFKK